MHFSNSTWRTRHCVSTRKRTSFLFSDIFFCSAIIIFFVLLKIFSFFVCSHKTKFDDANLSRQTDCAICQTSGFLFRRWKGKKFDNNSSRVQRLRKWTQLILASSLSLFHWKWLQNILLQNEMKKSFLSTIFIFSLFRLADPCVPGKYKAYFKQFHSGSNCQKIKCGTLAF